MRLNELHLSNYRNYDSLTLTFEKGLVIFLGENAQGKTNILESIYVLAMTKSHRTSSEQELIRWDTEGARISGSVSRGRSTIPLELFLSKKGRKTKVNHIDFICSRRPLPCKRKSPSPPQISRYGNWADRSNLSL